MKYATALAREILDMQSELDFLRSENFELREYRDKYMAMLDENIAHGQHMMFGLLGLAMKPGVMDAIAASNSAMVLPDDMREVEGKFGDHMTLADWQQARACGAIIEDDGSGYWATETHYSWEHSSFAPKPEWATHVMWFNK